MNLYFFPGPKTVTLDVRYCRLSVDSTNKACFGITPWRVSKRRIRIGIVAGDHQFDMSDQVWHITPTEDIILLL